MTDCVRNDAVAAFILESVLGIKLCQPMAGFVIVDERGMPVGAFVFNNHSGPNVELTICCDLPLGVRATRFIARMAFVDLQAWRITAHTRVENERVIRAMKKLGFHLEGRSHDHFGLDDDAYVFGLLKRDQRLI